MVESVGERPWSTNHCVYYLGRSGNKEKDDRIIAPRKPPVVVA
jgi:hypothetical protein